jgi:hypothetical protein
MPGDHTPTHIAAQDGMSLVRVAAHPQDDQVSIAPVRGDATVLAVVVQPEEWQAQMPQFSAPGKQVKWPERGKMCTQLQEAVESAKHLRFEPLENPVPSMVNKATADGATTPVEVFHYCGFGEVRDGREQIAVSDGFGDVEWRDIDDLFGWVAQSGARLFVADFSIGRVGTDADPVRPRTFLRALSNRVNAVVFTRFPVHPRQSYFFNKGLYDALGDGRSIEAAVQRARKNLLDNRFLGDAAGFGWFTLLTGPRADTQLVDAAPGGLRDRPKPATPNPS